MNESNEPAWFGLHWKKDAIWPNEIRNWLNAVYVRGNMGTELLIGSEGDGWSSAWVLIGLDFQNSLCYKTHDNEQPKVREQDQPPRWEQRD